MTQKTTPSSLEHSSSKKTNIFAVVHSISKLFWEMLWSLPRLLRQPRFVWQHTFSEATTQEEMKAQALAIAASNVRHCIEPRKLLNGEEKLVLCAGVRNFREPWARDFGFATFGLLSLGEQKVVRECLEAFLLYQKDSGQFPVKLHSTNVLERYLHSLFKRQQPIEKPLRPKYQTAHRTVSLDGNCLLVIAALYYVQATEDHAFLRRHWNGLCRAVQWLEDYAKGEDGLLHQGAYTDWADSIARTGRILYTNVLYWKALSSMAEASHLCEEPLQQEAWQRKVNELGANIQTHFWREDLGYFITSDRFHSLSSSGNALAIVWGLANATQAQAILDTMAQLHMADPVPTQVVSLPYRSRDVAMENRIAGIPEYHTHAAWLWLGGWHVIALVKMGRLAEAETLINRISTVIVRDGVVHEVYGKNGRFLSAPLYTSEAPLTWNASMVIHAFDLFDQRVGTG